MTCTWTSGSPISGIAHASYRHRAAMHSISSGVDACPGRHPSSSAATAPSRGASRTAMANSATVIRLVPAADDADAYATAQGPRRRLVTWMRRSRCEGAPTEHLTVALTHGVPSSARTGKAGRMPCNGRRKTPPPSTSSCSRLEHARSAEEAVRAAASFGIPAQNLLVADSDGPHRLDHRRTPAAARRCAARRPATLDRSRRRLCGLARAAEPTATHRPAGGTAVVGQCPRRRRPGRGADRRRWDGPRRTRRANSRRICKRRRAPFTPIGESWRAVG